MPKPIFVKIDKYKEILDVISLAKNNIKEANLILEKIYELKNQEDDELELWKNELENIKRKIKFMDETLLEPENH